MNIFLSNKRIAIFLVTVLSVLFALSGCSSTKASDKAVSIAKQAIEAVDDYLDGKITYDSVSAKIDDLCNEMAYVDDLDRDDEHKAADYSISVSISTLPSDLLWDNYHNDDESYAKVVETRNELAEEAGLKKR